MISFRAIFWTSTMGAWLVLPSSWIEQLSWCSQELGVSWEVDLSVLELGTSQSPRSSWTLRNKIYWFRLLLAHLAFKFDCYFFGWVVFCGRQKRLCSERSQIGCQVGAGGELHWREEVACCPALTFPRLATYFLTQVTVVLSTSTVFMLRQRILILLINLKSLGLDLCFEFC